VTVYVDSAIHVRRGAKTSRAKKWCHLFSADLKELSKFAESLGISKRRLDGATKHPHFDLTSDERSLAISAGAVEADRKMTALLLNLKK
jgi:hypothetical protein